MTRSSRHLIHVGAVVAGVIAAVALGLPALQALFVFNGSGGSDQFLFLLVMPAALSPLPLSIIGSFRPGLAGRGMLAAAAIEAACGCYVLISAPGPVDQPLTAATDAVLTFAPQLLSGALFLFVQRHAMHGQDAVVVKSRRVRAGGLTGLVKYASAAAAGVLVEECSPDWVEVLSVTRTDDTGRFDLRAASGAPTHFLRFSLPGAGTSFFRVEVLPNAPELEVRMKFDANSFRQQPETRRA
jgi:hypothetical protein